MVPFPSLCPSDEGIFLHYLLWERGQALGGKSSTIVGVPLEFLTLRLVYTEPPALCQFQFRISYPGSGSRGRFLLVNPRSGKSWLTEFTHLSNFGGRGLPRVLPSFKDPRGVIDFSVCSASYLLLGQSGDFQATRKPNQKLEVSSLFLIHEKLETAQVSINKKMDKQNNGILFNKKRKNVIIYA